MLEIVPNIWIFQKNSLYLPRQKVAFGYPGRIPRGQAVYVTTHFILAMPKVLFDYPGKFPARG